MQNLAQTVLVFALGLIGGIVGGLLFSSDPQAAGQLPGDGSPSVLQSDTELVGRLDGMQGELDLIQDELAQQRGMMMAMDSRMAQLPPPGPQGSMGPGGDPFAQLDPSEIPTGMGFDAAVNAAIEKREEDERAARDERRQQFQKERMDEQMERYVAELGLDEGQADRMRTVLEETSERRNAFFTEMREAGTMDRQLIRDTMTELSESQNEQLSNILTSDQMSSYEGMNSDFGFGGRGMGGGGRSSGSGSSGGGGRGGF